MMILALTLQCFLRILFQLVGAAFGAAGQRCMALSTAVFVGEAKEWIPELVERAKKLNVNAGNFCFQFTEILYIVMYVAIGRFCT